MILRGPAVEEPDTPTVGPGDLPEATNPGTSGETTGETPATGETTPETPSTGETTPGTGESTGEDAGQTDPEGGTPPLVVDLPPAA